MSTSVALMPFESLTKTATCCHLVCDVLAVHRCLGPVLDIWLKGMRYVEVKLLSEAVRVAKAVMINSERGAARRAVAVICCYQFFEETVRNQILDLLFFFGFSFTGSLVQFCSTGGNIVVYLRTS